MTKQPGEVEAVRGDVSGVEGGLKGVLSLWREKVFALLVQARLQQMQHSREMHEAQCRVSQLCTCTYTCMCVVPYYRVNEKN